MAMASLQQTVSLPEFNKAIEAMAMVK